MPASQATLLPVQIEAHQPRRSRRVVGWAMQAEMTAQLVTDALIMAIWRRGEPDSPLHHSDSQKIEGGSRAVCLSQRCPRCSWCHPLPAIFGSLDAIVPAAETKQYEKVPGASVTTIDGVRHSPMVQAPDKTLALIRAFLLQNAEWTAAKSPA